MPKTIGGTRISKRNIDVIPGGIAVSNLGSIRDIENTQSRLAVQSAISRFQAEYGIATRDIRIGDLDGAYGVAFIGGPNEGRVVLNRKLFNNYDALIKSKRAEYRSGFKVSTNAPVKHTVIHEMAHIKWNDMKKGAKYAKASAEIRKLYKEFRLKVVTNMRRNRTARKQSPLGMYATTNINEFYAEALTGSIIGTRQNRFTRAIKRITKKYNL
jgi:hypothetical protein